MRHSRFYGICYSLERTFLRFSIALGVPLTISAHLSLPTFLPFSLSPSSPKKALPPGTMSFISRNASDRSRSQDSEKTRVLRREKSAGAAIAAVVRVSLFVGLSVPYPPAGRTSLSRGWPGKKEEKKVSIALR